MTSIGRGMLLAAVLCAAATVESGVAAGATYTVLSCKDRAGAPAPASDTAGGWTPGSSAQPGVAWADDCATSAGGLEATVSGPWAEPVFSKVWWRFVPPAGTSIQDVSILYSGFARPVSGQNRGIVYVWGLNVVNLAEHYGVGVIAARWLTRQGLHEPWIQAVAECDGAVGASDCPAGLLHASVTILRSEMVLADSTPPDAGAVGGSATASGTWRGTQTFAFPATDLGSGVYQMQLDVDGSPAITRTIEDW